MFHSNTELLIDYWRGLAGPGGLPARGGVDPSDFAPLAPKCFVVARETFGEFRFRLAGEAVIDLHGRQLRGDAFGSIWRQVHRRRTAGLLGAALAAVEPVVIGAEGWTDGGARLRLEILLAPLASANGAVDRLLGLYQPLSGELSGLVEELAIIGAYGVAGEPPGSHLRLAAVDGRLIA
jgi:hypothetical protein